MILLVVACFGPGPTDTPGATGSGTPTESSSGDPTPTEDDVEALLRRLRTDREATMIEVSRETGWPAPVAGGWLFVSTLGASYGVAGDFDDWTPEALTAEDGFAWIVRPAEPGQGYKFTDGVDWVADPWARAYRYDSFGELSLLPDPDAGHLERQYHVEGQGLAARTLHLWVPAGGHSHTLYMTDGQNLFDPEGPAGGWRLDEVVPEGILVVGVDNSDDRMDEYTHTEDFVYGAWYGGAAATYGQFLEEDVRPLVAGIYGEEGTVGLLGSSLGGLLSLVVAHDHPGRYQFAGSMSGTLGWGSIAAHNPTIVEILAAAGHGTTPIFLDSGGGGSCVDTDGDGLQDDGADTSDNYCETLQLRDTLAGVGYQFDADLWHWWEPGATHDEAAWAARVARPLGVFAGR